MEKNEVLEKLPKHLLSLVIEQPYNEYTAQDHAVWRYVMRQNVRYLPKVAHHSYLDGLKRTGISIDQIPHMYGMNRILKDIGWAAVAVDGFIPPSAFMEFQAYNVLVIAADIRPIDQIEYTPAPDIIHEAAGHAPIIADPEYADYLRLFGEIGSKAFPSALDYKIYEAIRHLSILKADPYSTALEIKQAESELMQLESIDEEQSEMSLIRNLHWWTVEYGLIGTLENPKIYGAGLLSSIGESYSSLQPAVRKIPYTIDAVNQGFDITTRQPQLFVTPDFEHLSSVLDEFACRMALRKGGLYGIRKAIGSQNTATITYSSGLQITGTFKDVIQQDGEPVYIKTVGPTSLNYQNHQLDGHDKSYHAEGFGSPIGKLKNIGKPLEYFTDGELAAIGIRPDNSANLEFLSGVVVSGKLKNILRRDGRILLLTFTDCRVTYQKNVLFEKDWGIYDMAVGEKIYSAIPGAVDPGTFGFTFKPPEEKTHKLRHTSAAEVLHSMYQRVRDIRENKKDTSELNEIFKTIKSTYPEEWLLPLEILELSAKQNGNGLTDQLIEYISLKKESNPELTTLIDNGLEMVSIQEKAG